MSKKLFSLIRNDTLHTAPLVKVLPQETFSTLLSAEEVITTVKEDALNYKKEVAKECEALKEAAYREGYEAGFQKWAEHLLKMEKEIHNVRAEYNKMLAPIALKATQKIVGTAFEMDSELVAKTVSNALKPVLQHKRITLYVNKNDIAVLEKYRNNLKNLFENIELLSIRERDDIQPGGCIIETEGGIINAQLENQWAVLEKAFESLFKELSFQQKKTPLESPKG